MTMYKPFAVQTPPIDAAGRRLISVRLLLEWSFGTEKATLEADAIGASSGAGRVGVGMEYILQQRFMLGGVAIDTSPGRSTPADDAEIVASVVGSVLPWRDALIVAEHARAGTTPDWMPGAVPRLQPAAWQGNQHGWFGKPEDARHLGSKGWPPMRRRNRKQVIVEEPVRYTPCVWAPTASQISAARRRYLDWWGYLLTVQSALRQVGLGRWSVTKAMPPMTPWRKED